MPQSGNISVSIFPRSSASSSKYTGPFLSFRMLIFPFFPNPFFNQLVHGANPLAIFRKPPNFLTHSSTFLYSLGFKTFLSFPIAFLQSLIKRYYRDAGPQYQYELPRLNSLAETTLFRRGFRSGWTVSGLRLFTKPLSQWDYLK